MKHLFRTIKNENDQSYTTFNYDEMPIKNLRELVVTDSFMIFGIWYIGILFMAFGFQTGFSAENHLWGLAYLMYLIGLVPLILCFYRRFRVYKKYSYFGQKRKFIIDTIIYVVFEILLLLNGVFFNKYIPQDKEGNFNIFPFEHNYFFLVLFILPIFAFFWIYLDRSIQNKPRKIYKRRLLN